MENLVIPEIPQLEYCGQKVLTTPQIAALLKCKRQSINDNFKNHRTEFVEGVDYFFLKSEEFRNFRQNLQANGLIQPQANGNYQPLKKQGRNSTTPPQIAAPKVKKPKFKENLTFEQLQFLISHCTNDNLRDELIKAAFKLLQ